MKYKAQTEVLIDVHTGESSRQGIAPFSALQTPPLPSSLLPGPCSAFARSRPPLLQRRGEGGLYPGRGKTEGFPPSAQAGDTTKRK